MQSRVRFNRVGFGRRSRRSLRGFGAEPVPGKVPEALVQKPGQVQQGSGEGSGEGSSKPWCKGKSGSTGSREGAETIAEKVFGIFGAGPGQVQRVPEKVPEKVAEKAPEKVAEEKL